MATPSDRGPKNPDGSSNSHPHATSGARQVEAGIDTWSVCWYVREGSSAEKALKQLATVRAARSLLLPDKVADHRAGWFPGTRLLFAEGHPSPSGLASSSELTLALERVVDGLKAYGILPERQRVTNYSPITSPMPRLSDGVGFGGVRRLDATVNLRFEDPLEGLATMAGVAALPLPRTKTQIIREAGGRRIETVYFRGISGKKVLGRWYDKGVEAGIAERGTFLRPEDQRRFPKSARVGVDVLAETSFVRDSFVRRFEPLWQAAQGIKVSKARGLATRLGELVARGEITPRTAESLAGYLLLEETRQFEAPLRTQQRRRSQARSLGLALADGATDEVEIDLCQVIERAFDAESWGTSG